MKKIFSVLLFMGLLCINHLIAQEKYTISGVITDINSNETLIGVNIIVPELKTGTITNEYGFYSITLPEGSYNIIISYLGFNTISEMVLNPK